MEKENKKIFKKIDKYSLGYKLLRAYAMFSLRHFFYNTINIYGFENIPKDKPYMVAPNHQNAFMDAAVAIYSFKMCIFIARADLFINKTLAKIIEWLKIMPAYRIRDGKENLSKNDAIFKRSAEILQKTSPIIIFPEASHNNKRFLLPLKKGLARTAFQTEAVTNFTLKLSVIPTGIYYDNYENALGNVTVVFGKPISITDFKDEFLANEQRALNLFNKRLADEMKQLIINIENIEFYDTIDFLRLMYRNEMYIKLNLQEKNTLNDLIADKETIKNIQKWSDANPQEMQILHSKTQEYRNGLKKLNLRNWLFQHKKLSSISLYLQSFFMLLLFPLHLWCLLNNYLPMLPAKFINKKFKDRQFHSSVKFVMGVLIAPFIYILQMAIFSTFTDIWWAKWLYLLSLPFSLMFSLHYFRYYTKLKAALKFIGLQKEKNADFQKLDVLQKEIIRKVNEISNLV